MGMTVLVGFRVEVDSMLQLGHMRYEIDTQLGSTKQLNFKTLMILLIHFN